jgi:hypothetical protein
MADLVPGKRINREALERIIQRAAELQASELDTGEELSEQELLKLGQEVGIDGRFLRQALYEEGAGPRTAEKGFLFKWLGAGVVGAGRVVPGNKADVERALELWMTESEALTPKRRMADRTVWERQKGLFAEMKRGFGVGGKSYQLAKAGDITVMVTPLEAGFCHVEITADLKEKRSAVAAGTGAASIVTAAVGAGVISLLAVPALFVPIAAVPLAAAVVAPLIGARTHRALAQQVQLGCEQVLDRLERGEIKPKHQRGPAFGGVLGVVEEIRKAIEGPKKNKTDGRTDGPADRTTFTGNR